LLGEHPLRIAVHASVEAGARAARILLGERDLIELGTFRCSLQNPDDARVRRVEDLSGFDVLVSDATDDPLELAEVALDHGISCVLWTDLWDHRDAAEEYGLRFDDAGTSLVIGASLGPGIATALASHEVARLDNVFELTVGWTVPGKPLRKGAALPFPGPVGPLWGRAVEASTIPDPVPTQRYDAPVNGEWAGAMARVTGAHDNGVARRVVGVADHAGHLEGLAIAAAAVTAAAGAYASGLQWPAAVDEYLDRALAAGLTVAHYTLAADDA